MSARVIREADRGPEFQKSECASLGREAQLGLSRAGAARIPAPSLTNPTGGACPGRVISEFLWRAICGPRDLRGVEK